MDQVKFHIDIINKISKTITFTYQSLETNSQTRMLFTLPKQNLNQIQQLPCAPLVPQNLRVLEAIGQKSIHHPSESRSRDKKKERSGEVGRTRVPRHATNNKAPSAWPRCCKDRIDASLHLVAVHRCAPLHASAPDPRSLHLHARRSTTSNRTTDFKLAPALSPNCVNALTKLNFISFETLTALIVPPSSSSSSSSSSNSRKLHTQCVSSSEN